jgi:lipopolysaccharide biosynthesis glycosyltransferase
MKNELNENKVALFTMCSNNLIDACLNMLYSFLINNNWFLNENAGDIIILCDKKFCKLNKKNREKLLDIYSNIIFKEVDYHLYAPLIKHQEEVLHTPTHFKPVTYKYELFNNYGYKKHVFFDADMIITDNIRELFFNEITFGACLDVSCLRFKSEVLSNYNSNNPNVYINAGMMVVGEKLMNDNVFKLLYKFSLSLTHDFNFKKTLSWKGKLIEQDVINEVIHNYTILPYYVYNHSHIIINENNYKTTKIVHYCGAPKPWETNEKRLEIPHMLYYKYDFLRKNKLS